MRIKKFAVLGLTLVFFSLPGCASHRSVESNQEKHEIEGLAKEIRGESDQLVEVQKNLMESLEKKAAKEIEFKPVMPKYNPLDDQKVSFSMVGEDMQLVLYSLAKTVGMNLILAPELAEEKYKITLSFENVAASTVLDEMLETYDLYYEINDNVIRVKPYEERIFKLNFLDTNIDTSFDVGGDVLGAGETETASGLSGNFKLSGQGARQANAYGVVEDMVKRMVSNGGKYSVNRLSGSLYIKDRPAVVKSAARLINYLRDMLSRQILIEARIIEVTLSDEYSYGIDWSVVRDKSSAGTRYDSVGWDLGSGLVLRRIDKYLTIDATLNALKTFGDTKIVSNPTIRAKRGQPAMISVVTSYTYK